MDLYNNTKNQHFVSQAEQRLNTSTPHLDPSQMRILAYDVIDRETYRLSQCSENGYKIVNNLSNDNIFTFDAASKSLRGNFEQLFQKYENIGIASSKRVYTRLINRIAPKERHLKDLLLGKMVNFIRNPYSVRKIINTFGAVLSFQPADETALKLFNLVREGNRPQRDYLCDKLHINQQEYDDWLRIIFMLLYPMPGDGFCNTYERVIDSFFKLETSVPAFTFGVYTKGQNVILSDRGYSIIDTDAHDFTIEFNVCANCHLSFSIADVTRHIDCQNERQMNLARLMATKHVFNPHFDNPALVNGYNARAIYQAHKKIYCSHPLLLDPNGFTNLPQPQS